ncbi:MAG: hypothetical protein PHH90_02900 [Limnochordia bacterium]|nr:hypothetical protein [Limnochordia bacterium]
MEIYLSNSDIAWLVERVDWGAFYQLASTTEELFQRQTRLLYPASGKSRHFAQIGSPRNPS